MRIWVDAQLSPALAPWLSRRFHVEAMAIRDLDLREVVDSRIFAQARLARAVVMTKDEDFVELLRRRGPPPQVLWITCGNTSNQRLRAIFSRALPRAIALLRDGEPLVEISGDE